MFRLSIRSMIELSVALVLGLSGLTMLLGTLDEYKSGRAFDRGMDYYVAGHLQPAYDYLNEAVQAKSNYDSPLEALGKLYIDDGRQSPLRLKEARELFQELYEKQKAKGDPTLATVIGLAVAELEVALRSKGTALEHALPRALARLREGEKLYPESGDLHLNLATLDLLADNVEACRKRIQRVYDVGDLSRDGLPYLYNVEGLVALIADDLDRAVEGFTQATAFDPRWGIPRLNLAAAHARQLVRDDLTEKQATYHVAAARDQVRNLKRINHPLLPVVHHRLAVHHVAHGNPTLALFHCAAAKKAGAESWHAGFTTVVARYLEVLRMRRLSAKDSVEYHQSLGQDLKKVLAQDDKAATEHAFPTACMFGTIDAKLGKNQDAITHFERALKLVQFGAAKGQQEDVVPKLHRCIAALYLIDRHYEAAVPHLEACRSLPDRRNEVAKILERLRRQPLIEGFAADQVQLLTDYDVRYSARLVAPATPIPIALDKIRLTLADELTGVTRPAPFRFTKGYIHGVIVNLPQGKFRLELQFTDALGNRSTTERREFEIDREPPRILERIPAQGAAVNKLDTLRFVLYDAISKVDLETVSVTLRCPTAATATSRLLVSRGKYMFDARDGSVSKTESITNTVTCPVPSPTPPGEYTVLVRGEDTGGRQASISWTFRLATEKDLP